MKELAFELMANGFVRIVKDTLCLVTPDRRGEVETYLPSTCYVESTFSLMNGNTQYNIKLK